MSGRIQFVVNDVSLQLYEDFDESFWITRQVHDLRNLETRNASTTKSITIPAVSTNLLALGLSSSLFDVPSTQGIKIIPCNILIDELEVVPQADLLITGVNGKYISLEITLLWGNFDFFELIKRLNINDADYSDLDLEWNIAGVTAIAQKTTGIVFCIDEWYDIETYSENFAVMPLQVQQEQDIRVNGFWIYTKEILTRIAAEGNYTIDDSLVTWPYWDTAAIACAAHKWVEIPATVGAYTGSALKGNTQTITDQPAPVILSWVGTVYDPYSQWNAVLYRWAINTGTATSRQITFVADLNVIHTQQNPSSTPYLAIRVNGINAATQNFTANFTGIVNLQTTASVVTGDFIDVVAFMPDGPGSNGSSVQILQTSTIFKMQETSGFDPSNLLNVVDYLPDITAEEFTTSLFNIANVIPSVDRARRILNLISFDKILDSEEQDFSSKLAVNYPIKSTNLISTYFQNNEFKYNDSGYLLREDVNGVSFFRDELLQPVGTIIQLKYDACDFSLGFPLSCSGSFYPVERINAVGVNVTVGTNTFTTQSPEEWEIGDYIEITSINTDVMRITGRIDALNGTVSGNWSETKGGGGFNYYFHAHSFGDFSVARIGNIEQVAQSLTITDGVFQPGSGTLINAYRAQFPNEFKFQSIIDTEYKRLLKILEVPFVVEAWFQFTVTEYLEISILRLVYINFFDSVYYVNKMEQYKLDKPVRIELIKAKSF